LEKSREYTDSESATELDKHPDSKRKRRRQPKQIAINFKNTCKIVGI